MTAETHIYDFGVRVLIYREDGNICAHALELDLLGCGKSEKEAVLELTEMIQSQITFARFKNDEGLLPFRAPKELYQKWEAAQAAALKNEISTDQAKAMEIKAVWITLGHKRSGSSKSRFRAMPVTCA